MLSRVFSCSFPRLNYRQFHKVRSSFFPNLFQTRFSSSMFIKTILIPINQIEFLSENRFENLFKRDKNQSEKGSQFSIDRFIKHRLPFFPNTHSIEQFHKGQQPTQHKPVSSSNQNLASTISPSKPARNHKPNPIDTNNTTAININRSVTQSNPTNSTIQIRIGHTPIQTVHNQTLKPTQIDT
jgi:hypothetical protein